MSARHGSLARWLAGHLRCTVAEADERLQASRRAAFRMTATNAEWQADDDYQDATAPRTGVRVVVDDVATVLAALAAQTERADAAEGECARLRGERDG